MHASVPPSTAAAPPTTALDRTSGPDVGGRPSWAAAIGVAAWPPPRIEVGGSDALRRACPPSAAAALDACWSLGTEGGVAAIAAAGRAGAPAPAVALAMWAVACPGREPRLSKAWCDQLQRSWAQLDRCHGPGAAANYLAAVFADIAPGEDGWVGGIDRSTGNEVHTIVYVIRGLKGAARNAARYARVRSGRRTQGAPTRWHKPRGHGSAW